MAKYCFNCQKCTNKYYRANPDGSVDEWCRPWIDNGTSPIKMAGDRGANFVFRDESYTAAPGIEAPLPSVTNGN